MKRRSFLQRTNLNKFYYSVICILLIGTVQVFGASINIIPYPAKVTPGEGSFVISPETGIIFSKELKMTEGFYTEIIEAVLGFPLAKEKGSKNLISFRLDENPKLPDEGYRINITSEKVEVSASSSKGIFYGIQSLNQLILKEADEARLPVVNIEDYPRFNWRGCMLDLRRTYKIKTHIKRYIDIMAYYKLNILHLHLIDDQGWRIEIKRYPRLTSVGSKFDAEFNEMGGYYTQEDIKEIVEYASLRNITIVPEFELPGHECAAIAAYPELSCRGVRPQIHPFLMGPGIHEEIFCAGKTQTYEFIYNVLDEIMALFPSRYIHIGGDEAPKVEWKKCDHCQQAMRENNLNNEEELQSHFVKRIGDYLSRKGKILIGWDEIIDGGKLKGDEFVMYWRGWKTKEVAKAAQQGFKIISCPTTHCYFDYGYESINTNKVYMYEPVPLDIPANIAENYVGVQANFWSHINRSERGIDRQLFPRLFALAEIAWSSSLNKDWHRFKRSAREHCIRLRENQVDCYYDKSIYEP